MTYALTWIPDVLLAAGLKVAPVPGWQTRGHGDMGAIKGVMCHHTAGPRGGNMPSLRTLVTGRHDLPGPLAQLGVGRDGTYYVIAAGRCHHAGAGKWLDITAGNSHFIGIEAENTGLADDQPWPAIQLRALEVGIATLLRHAGLDASCCAGHKEYALPAGRKPDPSFDMAAFRTSVAALMMTGTTASVSLIPPVEAAPAPDRPARRTLRRGDRDEAVKQIRVAAGMASVSDHFDAATEAAVREFQRNRGLVPDGIVGPKTWAAIDVP